MLRFVADENFNNNIVRGLLRRQPELDIVRVQDVGLTSADDPMVLKWASQEGRILLTHDVATITQYAYERVEAGLSMPGVFEMSLEVPISRAIEDIYYWRNVVLMANGKGKYVTFPCKIIPFS